MAGPIRAEKRGLSMGDIQQELSFHHRGGRHAGRAGRRLRGRGMFAPVSHEVLVLTTPGKWPGGPLEHSSGS